MPSCPGPGDSKVDAIHFPSSKIFPLFRISRDRDDLPVREKPKG